MTKRRHALVDEIEQARKMMAGGMSAKKTSRELNRHHSTIIRWKEDWEKAIRDAPRRGAPPRSEPSSPPRAPSPGTGTSSTPTPVPEEGATPRFEKTSPPNLPPAPEPYKCGACHVELDHHERPSECPSCGSDLAWDKAATS